MNELLFFAGLVVLTGAFFSFSHPLVRRLGLLSFAGTVFAAGYLSTGNIWAGVACILGLLLFPWVEILLRIRKLRLPLRKRLRQTTPPSREMFPELEIVTDEVRAQALERRGHWERCGAASTCACSTISVATT